MHTKAFDCHLTLVCRLMLVKRNNKLISQLDVDGNHPLVSLGKWSWLRFLIIYVVDISYVYVYYVDVAVSKVLPSPDWVVGVDSLSLCRGSRWLSHLALHLHLTDLGLLAGVSYQSPVFPERRPLQRITSNFPDDENSPFFNVDNVGVKPFARLSFHKLRN